MNTAEPGLPAGFRIAWVPGAVRLQRSAIAGGVPLRVLRLSPAGQGALAELESGPVRSSAAGRLGRHLVDRGVARAIAPPSPVGPDLIVVVPARDRADDLERCLHSLGSRHGVVVVDDASLAPGAIARVAARHGARLIRRECNGGPAAARNTGVAATRSELVAFVDSDCLAGADALEQLCAHFADPTVAAVAPRVLPEASDGWLGRYGRARSCLDLGEHGGDVSIAGRISYVPSTTLVIRRSALAALGGEPFDPALRFGEDVDLIWRLLGLGCRVRYEPATQVRHLEPRRWRATLRRRYDYGTSAGALAHRHAAAVAPLRVSPLAAVLVATIATAQPVAAVVAAAAVLHTSRRTLIGVGVPPPDATRLSVRMLEHTGVAAGRYLTQLGWPLALMRVVSGGHRTRWMALATVLAPPAREWLRRRPAIDPARSILASMADDMAYETGVLAGALACGSPAAVRPRLVRSQSNSR